MSRTVIKVVQYVFVHDRGETGVVTIVENEKTNDTFRKESRHGTAPLYDCAVSNWEAIRELLISTVKPWKIRLNCNVLGVREEKRNKKGEYSVEVLADRHSHDSRLSTVINRAIRMLDEGEDEGGDEVEAAKAADETEPSDIGGWTSATKNTKGND